MNTHKTVLEFFFTNSIRSHFVKGNRVAGIQVNEETKVSEVK